ncbi:MAG: hypothetical protein FWG75_06335 [Cystobacterineae bacterium]|nr:hypothetical protein [Cystobacterineae bacterium]
MSAADDIQKTREAEFNQLLSSISADTPLLLFPLRIETHFRKGKPFMASLDRTGQPLSAPKELCVRIFPDEIFIDSLTKNLTKGEFLDGRFFWMQWFIASGSPKREYEAWQVLCTKYPAHRAAWIVRQVKPGVIRKFFKTDGPLFYRRPYPKMAEIEEACEDIYRELSHISLDEKKTGGLARRSEMDTGEKEIERKIREHLGKVKEKLFQIDCDVMFCEWIVDYLFDEIQSTVEYLSRRLDAFIAFYEKYPGGYGGNNRPLELWDVDQTMLMTFRKEVDEFLKKLSTEKRISLDALVQKYTDERRHDVFFMGSLNASEKPDIPVSNIFPDRFMFVGEIKGKENQKLIRYGQKINQNLQMGIHPGEDMEEEPYKINADGELEVSGGISWMVDYEKAEKAGLAITVPLEGTTTFNYVYVLGVKDADRMEACLENVFNSHNYTSGLEMLKTGTPTNIVEGGNAAIRFSPEEEMRHRYEIEVKEASLREPHADHDARRLSAILHLDHDECWGHAAKFDNREMSNAEKVNKALWSHFRKNLQTNDAKLTDDAKLNSLLDFVGEFVTSHVKARGVLPSFRIGRKPYGILPVTDFLKLGAHIPQNELHLKQLSELLISLADKWKSIRNAKVLSSETLKGGDAAAKYLEMVGLTPRSTTFYERTLIDSPLLPRRDDFSEAQAYWGGYVLLPPKHATVPPYFASLDGHGFFNPLPVSGSEKEVEFPTAMPSGTRRRPYALAGLAEVARAALSKQEASDEECQLLVSEFLDIFTHRLDAWFSGLLDFLLRSKAQTPNAQNAKPGHKTPRLGAFGWVFNLEENARTEVSSQQRSAIIQKMKLKPKDASDELRIYANSAQNLGSRKGEYIVAPSIQHAITAAILRGAYINTKGGEGDSHMCINLSSMRARQALRMVSGIQEGMSTGIVLGADLERHLHEAYRTGNEMDAYVYPLRKLFPQTVNLHAEDERAREHVMQVVNGEALLNTFMEKWNYSEPIAHWLEKNRYSLPWYSELNRATNIDTKTNHRICLFKLIARLVDSYDALNDLLLAEGVHRLVQGDRASFSAISQFMAEGKGALPEPSVLDTPMEYVVVSNKVAIALPECKTPPARPMCLAEPSLNAWLEELMGGLEKIYFYVEKEGEEKEALYTRCTLGELGVSPIEYLYFSSNDNLFLSYLETLFRLKNNGWTDKLTLHVNKVGLNDEEGGGVDETEDEAESFSLYENELRISRLRSLVLQGGAMKANDLTTLANSDAEDEMAVDMEELKARHASLHTCLSQLHFEMHSCLEGLKNQEEACDDETLAKVHALLCRCVESGLINSLPKHNTDMFVFRKNADTHEEEYHLHPIFQRPAFDKALEIQNSFIEAFTYAHQQLEERICEAEKIMSGEICTLAQCIQAIQKLTLDNFKVFPRFTLHHALPREKRKEYDEVLKQGIGRYENLSDTGFEVWQSELAEVREGMKRWHHISMFQNMCNADTGKVSILQATSEGDTSLKKWLGCHVEQESELHDVDSLVLYNSEAISRWGTEDEEASYNAAIVIDAWPEFIPYKKQTAGMVFQCKQPGNEAPQALLLALHPEFNTAGKKWNIESVLELLDSTRFMLMNRAVEPSHIYEDAELSTLFPLLSSIILQ